MPMTESKNNPFLSVKLDLKLKNKLKEKAKSENLTLSQYVTRILSNDQEEILRNFNFLKSLFENEKVEIYTSRLTPEELTELDEI